MALTRLVVFLALFGGSLAATEVASKDDYSIDNHTDVAGGKARQRRTLLHTDPSKMLLILGVGTPLQLDRESVIVGLYLKFNYALPSNSSDYTEPGVLYTRGSRSGWSRWSIYKIAEKLTAMYGLGGKECLLRAICEVASAPFDTRHGLAGQLVQAFFRPSRTEEEYDEYEDREYHAAERLGEQLHTEGCHALYPECRKSVLDVFSTVLA